MFEVSCDRCPGLEQRAYQLMMHDQDFRGINEASHARKAAEEPV